MRLAATEGRRQGCDLGCKTFLSRRLGSNSPTPTGGYGSGPRNTGQLHNLAIRLRRVRRLRTAMAFHICRRPQPYADLCELNSAMESLKAISSRSIGQSVSQSIGRSVGRSERPAVGVASLKSARAAAPIGQYNR